MLTSSFPAFGLGLEAVSSDVMRRPPHDTKAGVFTRQILTDMVMYGVIMGICSLCTFIIIVYGVGDGNLGSNCNARYSSECDLVFRARAAVFAQLTWLILVSAWEFKSIRRSMFRLDPYQTEHRFPFFRDVSTLAITYFTARSLTPYRSTATSSYSTLLSWALFPSSRWYIYLGSTPTSLSIQA